TLRALRDDADQSQLLIAVVRRDHLVGACTGPDLGPLIGRLEQIARDDHERLERIAAVFGGRLGHEVAIFELVADAVALRTWLARELIRRRARKAVQRRPAARRVGLAVRPARLGGARALDPVLGVHARLQLRLVVLVRRAACGRLRTGRAG